MAKIKVTPEELETAAGNIEQWADDYDSQYKALYAKTDAMASSWSGKDNQAYINQIEGFKEDFAKMYNLMNQYATFLRTSAKAYRTAQETIVEQAGKLRN